MCFFNLMHYSWHHLIGMTSCLRGRDNESLGVSRIPNRGERFWSYLRPGCDHNGRGIQIPMVKSLLWAKSVIWHLGNGEISP